MKQSVAIRRRRQKSVTVTALHSTNKNHAAISQMRSALFSTNAIQQSTRCSLHYWSHQRMNHPSNYCIPSAVNRNCLYCFHSLPLISPTSTLRASFSVTNSPLERDSKSIEGENGIQSSQASGESMNADDLTSTYRKMTPVQHILHRSDSYVGTTQPIEQSSFIMLPSFTSLAYQKNLKLTPAFFKIFDEILMNAVDNFHRKGTGTKKIWINITDDSFISIRNNGRSLPIKVHPQEKLWIPEMCFGHLLTGSNFNDQEIKYTAGRNGYGTKLCNIFSTKFKLEICDGFKVYRQSWNDNMGHCEEPTVEKLPARTEPYIEVSFRPDFEKLNTSDTVFHNADTEKEDPIVGLLRRRAFDVAACNSKLEVYWNDKLIELHSFLDYVKLFYQSGAKSKRNKSSESNSEHPNIVFKKYHPNWEVAIGPPLNDTISGGIDSSLPISFVNGIATSRGGTHVNHISYQISRAFMDHVQNTKDLKKLNVKLTPNQILNQMTIFINCRVENPTFDSQTKETLTNKLPHFADHAQIPVAFMKQIIKNTDILDQVLGTALARQQLRASREIRKVQNKRRLDIPKLDDANWAGTNRSSECTLIVTEGDSAKALAVAGLSVIGRDQYGVFPLKGKLMNIRQATRLKIEKNEELTNVRKILGLEYGKDYSIPANREKLRYGKIMLMCDQDHDGSHIKGLFINFIQFFWPQLLKTDFIEEFITPILKVNPNTKKEKIFFTIPEFEMWMNDMRKKSSAPIHVKYYKGLGTSTSKEAKTYFRQLEKHKIQFVPSGNPEEDAKAIELAFGKGDTATQERKDWLHQLKQGTHVNHSGGSLSFKDFVNQELILFSQYSNIRGIPSLVDGLKPSQRKILFCCLKRNLKNEIKVAQLAGYVSEHAAYHHGEMSLHSSIVNMAQNYVGSNNIPLLYPSGQFGTRLNGGKDHASARYIFTRLNELTRYIFHPDDDAILEYQEEDGSRIEPIFYVPIIPMALVNGAEGVGTGWSTFVPSFDWKAICDKLETLLANEEHSKIDAFTIPCHYEGFKGRISANSDNSKYISMGVVKPHPKNKYQFIIEELPVRKWTDDFKKVLHEAVREKQDKDGSQINITSFVEHNTESKVHIILNVSRTDVDNLLKEGQSREQIANELRSQLKLETSLSANNMTLFSAEGQIQRFRSPEEILQEYIPIRLEYYAKRKAHLLKDASSRVEELSNKVRFIECVMKKEIPLTDQPLSKTVKQLTELNFSKLDGGDNNYRYLTSLPISHFSTDQAEKLTSRLNILHAEMEALEQKSERDMWKKDLKELKAKILKDGLLA